MILKALDDDLAGCISDGSLAIESISSASNLSVRLESLRQQICRYYVFLGNDAAGHEAVRKAREEGNLSDREEFLRSLQV
jgi:hypothetical protein